MALWKSGNRDCAAHCCGRRPDEWKAEQVRVRRLRDKEAIREQLAPEDQVSDEKGMPERVWIEHFDGEPINCCGDVVLTWKEDGAMTPDAETETYIRADLHAAQVAELRDALAKERERAERWKELAMAGHWGHLSDCSSHDGSGVGCGLCVNDAAISAALAAEEEK